MRLVRLTSIWVLLLVVNAHAATGRIRGTVKDVNGKPVEKAVITLTSQGEVNQKFTAETNAKGEYVHIGVVPGLYRVTVSKEGFRPVEYDYIDLQIDLSDRGSKADFKMQAIVEEKADTPQETPGVKQAKIGIALLQEGKVDDAIVAFQKSLELDPSLATVHFNLGTAYQRKDNAAQARFHYQEAIKVRPDFGEAQLALGNTYLAERNFGAPAVDALTKATELLPQSYDAFYNLGTCYANAGKYAEAESAFRKAVEINPQEPVARYQLGMALLGQSKNEAAKSEFRKYLELNPNAADKLEVEELLKSM